MNDRRTDRRADRHIHRPTADRIYFCGSCGELAFYLGRGRPPCYCSNACRVRAWPRLYTCT
jgi:hypothetical protein